MASPQHFINVKSVESPILFFASDSNKSLSLEQRKELARFKNELSDMCMHLKQKKSYFQPAVNDLVAVYYKDYERWERGRVQCVFHTQKSVMYSVFLIDEGKSVNVTLLNMFQLPDMFRHLPPQVYQIGLYRVVPKEWSLGDSQKSIEAWSEKYKHIVEELFDAENIYFEKNIEMHGIHFGNVIIENVDKSLLDLTQELCKHNIVRKSTDFAKDMENFYNWKEDRNSCVKETIDYEDEKAKCVSVLKELDVTKTSISAIKEFIKQAVNKKSENYDLTSSSLSHKNEEHLQKKSTTSNLEQDITTQHTRNTSSKDSVTKYENHIRKVDKQTDYVYVPHGCNISPDMLKRDEECKRAAAAKIQGENFHNRSRFESTDNTGDDDWTETNNRRYNNRTNTANIKGKNYRRDMNRTDMEYKEGANWSETKVTNVIGTEISNRGYMNHTDVNHRKNMNYTKNKNTHSVNHTETKSRRDVNRIEINNKGDSNQAETSGRIDINQTNINNIKDMSKTDTYLRKGASCTKTEHTSSLGTEAINRGEMNWAGNNHKRFMHQSKNKHIEDIHHTETKNGRDINRTGINYGKDASWTETKDTDAVGTEVNNRGNMNQARINLRRNLLGKKSENTKDMNHTETKMKRYANLTETDNKEDMNQADTGYKKDASWSESETRRDMNWTKIDNKWDMNKAETHNRRDMNRPDTRWSETENTDVTGTERNSGDRNWAETNHTRNKNTEDVSHIEIKNRQCKNLTEINKKGDMKQAETSNRRDVNWSETKIIATQHSQANPDNSKTFDDFHNSGESRGTSHGLSSVSENKNDIDYSQQLAKSADDMRSNRELKFIASQKDVAKIKNENSNDASKNVDSIQIGTNTDIPVNSIDIKAMSKLSVKEIMNLLRESKKVIETTESCLDWAEKKVTNKSGIVQNKVNESQSDELQSLDRGGNQKNDMMQKTENVQPIVYANNNSEICRKPVNNMKNQIQLNDIQNKDVCNEENQEKCVNNKHNSVSNNTVSNDVKKPDAWPLPLTDKNCNLKESSPSPASPTSSIASNQEKESLGLPSIKPKNRYSDSTYFSYSKKIPVLLHGDNNYEPILSVGDMTQDNFIFQCLQKWKLRDLTLVQSYVCPVVGDRRDAVIVNSPRSGKSLSYIVPILSLLRKKNYYSKLRPGNGPRAVFVVSCSVSGEELYTMCSELVESLQDLKICLTYGGGAEMEVKDELINGCDVLISTPRCLLRLLEVPYLTSLNRVCHVVLDEADILLQNFLDELRKLIILLNKAKLSHNVPVQTIIASNTWNLTLEELVRQILRNPVICIASYLEAAIYARVKPVVGILKPDQKIHRLLEFLKSQSNSNTKTIILCNTKEDVLFVKQSVEHIGIIPLAAHEGIDFVYSENVVNSYWANNSPVVICSDLVLPELNITDAQCLVHFGLPETKKQFIFRFSCLLQSYKNMFKQDDKQKCDVHIYVDEENESQFPEIMKFMERLGTSVPKILEEVVKKINTQKEQNKGSVNFCENVKEFGMCWNVNKCPFRHTLNTQLDQPKNAPMSGSVRLQILHVHNACHYSARILEHSTLETWTPIPSDYVNLVMDINNYFSDEKNRCWHGLPTMGDIAAVETSFNIYERAQVLKITEYNYKDEPEAVICKLLDSGSINKYQVLQLLYLPENFRKQRPESVDIYLCQLLPVDLDQNWSSAARTAVEEWVTQIQQQRTDSFIVGRIVLNIADSLWLEPLEHVKWLPLSKTFLSQLSFRRQLLKIRLAVENKTHLDALFQLCKEAEINIPYNKGKMGGKGKESTESTIKCQWAHLPRDEYTAVRVIKVLSLDMIFIQVIKFLDRLELIQKDIQAAVNKKMEKLSFPSLMKDDLCLGQYPDDNEWYRAQVVDNPTEQEVKLFFVDCGDYDTVTWDNVLPIPAEIISRLPFQVIECSLAGVIPIEDEETNAVDLLYDLTEEPESELPKILFARVCSIDLKAQKTGGRRYSVVLVDRQGEEDVVINKDFVLKGFGNWHPKEKHFLNNLPPVSVENSGYSDSDDCSEISDIEATSNEWFRETSASTELVVRSSTPVRPQEDVDVMFNYILNGLQDGTFDYVSPDNDFSEQSEKETAFGETKNASCSIQECSDAPTEAFSDYMDHSLEQSDSIHSGEAADEQSDSYNKTWQKDSIGEELQSEQLNPKNLEDTDSSAYKLNDSEMKQQNSINKVSETIEGEDVKPVVDELKGYNNEMLQTDIVDKDLCVEELEQREKIGITSAVLHNEEKQQHSVGKKLENGESGIWYMKDTDGSGLGWINETKHSCSSTDEFLENKTSTVETDLQINNPNTSNYRINQSDVSKYLCEDVNDSSDEVKQSKSDSSSSQRSRRQSLQLGLTEKLQSWFHDHMKTPDDSLQMQSENFVKERRRKVSNVTDKTDTDVETQDTDIVEESSIMCKKPVSDKVLQNVTDEMNFSSSTEEVPVKKRQSFIGMLQGWLGGNAKAKSDDKCTSEDQEMWNDEQRSLSAECTYIQSDTSQNMDESVFVTACSSMLDEQCNQKSASSDGILYAHNENHCNTETSKLNISLNDCSNNTHTRTGESEVNIMLDNTVSTAQTLSSSVTKEKHMNELDQCHNTFIKTHEIEDIDIKLLPQLVEKDSIRPQVMWHQDLFFVWLHVILNDVKKYKLLWSSREIYFRTVHNDRVYAFKMLLFGTMNPELLSHTAKGFHVEIKLVKTVRGREWSRLLKTELKMPWVKPNLEIQAQFYSDDEDEVVDSGAKIRELAYIPSPGRDRTEYDRLMYDTDDAGSSGSDVEDFEPTDNYGPV